MDMCANIGCIWLDHPMCTCIEVISYGPGLGQELYYLEVWSLVAGIKVKEVHAYSQFLTRTGKEGLRRQEAKLKRHSKLPQPKLKTSVLCRNTLHDAVPLLWTIG